MLHKISRVRTMFAALLLSAALTGCYKGDGTEVRPSKAPPVAEDSFADMLDAAFTDVTVSPDAPTDHPFTIDTAALKEPEQDIVLVMIYDCTEDKHSHTQAVNYFDKAGRVYRYRHPLDLNSDWLPILAADKASGVNYVSLMSDAERQTLWHLYANADRYRSAPQKMQEAGNPYGIRWIYLIDKSGSPVMLTRYDDLTVYPDLPEIVAFLNWFRYFFHSNFVYGS